MNEIIVKPAKLLTNIDNIYINNFNINFSVDSPSSASFTFTPQVSEMEIDIGQRVNIMYGNDAIYAGWVADIDRTLTNIRVSLTGFMQILDWYPVINDESNDGNLHFIKGTTIQEILNKVSQTAGWTLNPARVGFNTIIPSEMTFGNGQSFLEIIKNIADMNGAWIAERRLGQEVWLVLPSSIIDLGSEVESEGIIMDKTIAETNMYKFSQVLVRDTEGKLKRPVKVYHYQPYPYNKRAIFYTFQGQLDEIQATNIAMEIFNKLKVGNKQITYTLADYYNIELLNFYTGTIIVGYEYQYNYGERPFMKTILKCIESG